MADATNLVLKLVLPVLVGLIGAALSAFISQVVERARMIRTNREGQIKMSIDICKKIITALDTLYAHLYHDAYYIAYRKLLLCQQRQQQQQVVADNNKKSKEEMMELDDEDKERWMKFRTSLDDWRSKSIGFETDLKAFFGNTGYEAFLFLDVSMKVEQAADMLWTMYYYNDYVPRAGTRGRGGDYGYNCYNVPKWRAGSRPAMAEMEIRIDWNDEGQKQQQQQLQSMAEEYFDLMDRLKNRISTLSSTMIHCIQEQNVGVLAEKPEPIPESDQEEAMALLGNQMTQRYRLRQSKKSIKSRGNNKLGSSGNGNSTTEVLRKTNTSKEENQFLELQV